MFEEGHFFIILGLVADLIGARMIIQPILNFDEQFFPGFRASFRLSRIPSHFSSFGTRDLAGVARELSDSVDKRFDELERDLSHRFRDDEYSERSEQNSERRKQSVHYRYANVGYIVLAFGFFMQIGGVLLLSGVIYGN